MLKNLKKISILLVLVLVMSSVLAGCGEKIDSGKDESTSKEEGSSKKVKIGLVVGTGGLGDQNFNDMAYDGLKKAEEEFDIEIDYSEPQSVSDYEPFISQYAQDGSYDLILISTNEAHTALEKVADEYPEQKFSIVDTHVDRPNVKSILKDFAQMTFLNGYAAGKLTSDDSLEFTNDELDVGIILGMDIPNMQEAAKGFTAGAKLANKDVNVRVGDVNSFGDPVKAKEIAKSMYDNGSDIILNFAGGSGLGILNQAKESDLYAMGGASNQNPDAPDHVIASAIENLTEKCYMEVKEIIEDTWEPGEDIGSIKDDYVGITFEGSNIEVNQEILDEIEDIRQKIADGEIELPEKMDEIDSWVEETSKKLK